jgi:DNA-binding winged helix-turn-helix (wHTH) protein
MFLVENAGELVEKDTIISTVWKDRFVEESNLTYNIKMLRKALGDNAAEPTFIETIPRRGYRFLPPISEVFEEKKQSKPSKMKRLMLHQDRNHILFSHCC